MRSARILAVIALSLLLCGTARPSSGLDMLTKGRGRTVALTFDDGPRPGYVEPILDILRDKGVHATFFLVGRFVDDHPELVRAIDKGGHLVANHTYYHNNLTNLPPENVYKEWRLCSEAVERAIGKRPGFCRPPGGNYNDFVAEEAEGEGLRIVLWTNNPGDYTALLDAPALEDKVLARAREGDIVLLHVGVAPTIEALPGIIDGYLKKGFSFVTVDEMP